MGQPFKEPLDAVIVGAGFSGLYALYRLQKSEFDVRVIEAASGVGGTWYWNRYPGARCDIESMQYSYQFSEELQQEWKWSERYASQPEILSYIEHVVDRFDLIQDITFETRVAKATFDEERHLWEIQTDKGEVIAARFFIMSVGCLSSPIRPNFKGSDLFEGEVYQTSLWPKDEVIFSDKRVGIIGTGSSAIQSLPIVAEEAKHLYVFQRTPNFVVPAQNRKLSDDEIKKIKSDYKGFRARAHRGLTAFLFPRHDDSVFDLTPEEREIRLNQQWKIGGLPFLGAFNDILSDELANKEIVRYWRKRIGEIIDDPKTADLLTPKEIFGCKRLCAGTNYYETFNRNNVTLVDVSHTGIECITETSIWSENKEYELDMIIYATGFDAMTGSVTRISIIGTNGKSIQEKWSDGPHTYLGLATSGFPNMFNMVSVGSPSVLATMVTGAEHHGDWIGDCMDYMRSQGYSYIEATAKAEAAWDGEVSRAAEKSLRIKCDSWYVGSNVEGKPRVFAPYIGGWPPYVEKCNRVAENGYEGFTFGNRIPKRIEKA